MFSLTKIDQIRTNWKCASLSLRDEDDQQNYQNIIWIDDFLKPHLEINKFKAEVW